MLVPTHFTTLFTYNTYPNFKRVDLIKKYTTFYTSQKEHRTKILSPNQTEYENFHKPIHWHLYGSWDLLTIAFVCNSQIITKSIQTGFFEDSPADFMNAKINTGIMFEGIGLGLNDFDKINDFKLCGNINLTISKKWLLPNGYKLMNFIIQKILKISTNVVILNSFSSYELSILILGNKLSEIGELAQNIRELSFEKDDTQYNFKPLNSGTQLIGSNIFSDSNTSFGIRYDKGEIVESADIDVKMLIELEVRPSKNFEIINLLKSNDLTVNTKPGKFDVLAFKADYAFSSEIVSKIKESNLTSHVRNFKTILLFKNILPIDPKLDNTKLLSQSDDAGKNNNFIDCDYIYDEINKNLKVLKISKGLRYQILKMFFAYQNVIADPISYSYFLDLIYYVKNIEKYISKYASKVVADVSLPMKTYAFPLKVQKIETELKEFLEIFEEAYFIRYVNDHSLDEVVPDFMVRQSGGQLQGICSAYDNVAKFMLSSLYGQEFNEIVTSFDDTIIELKNLHIKLSASLLFEPATLLFILLKEVLNEVLNKEYKKSNKLFKNIDDHFENEYSTQIRRFLQQNIAHEIYDFKQILENTEVEKYLYNDYLRLSIFFNNDYQLYYYHHIASLLMTPSFYYSSGALRRGLLSRELYRLVLLALIHKRRTNSGDFLDYIRDNPPNIESKADWTIAYDDLRISLDTDQFNEVINIFDIYLSKLEKTVNERVLKSGECENIIKTDGIPTFHCFWQDCLEIMKTVKPNDTGVPSFLARNWETGDAQLYEGNRINKICNNNPDSYFLIDPQGGIYFHNYEKMKEYSIIRNQFLMNLMHMSSMYKTKLYRSYQSLYNGKKC